jgi:SpoVK/Ycf46/Vps4 family AAA+-type ATPase
MGTLLSWLSDHSSDVFFVGTANDVTALAQASSGAFTRAERFDALFFMDLPGVEQRDMIWNIYLKAYGFPLDTPKPECEGWTGAEIKACCRLAYLLNIPLVESAKQVVPVIKTSHEQVEQLRNWASGRCLSADYEGLYDKAAHRPQFVKDGQSYGARPMRTVKRQADLPR